MAKRGRYLLFSESKLHLLWLDTSGLPAETAFDGIEMKKAFGQPTFAFRKRYTRFLVL